MQFMRKQLRWWLLVAALVAASVIAPSSASAQQVPPVIFTGPLSHQPYDDQGLFLALGLKYMKTNRPLRTQEIAVRGFYDGDGFITGRPYNLIGSGDTALSTRDVYGPGLFQPGWDIFLGYRFNSGLVVELQWRHLHEARYAAQAHLIPPNFNVGNQFENTFLSAPVSNFPVDFAGNETNVPIGTSATTFGIWNAASFMQIDFTQRYDIYGLNARMPIVQNDRYRSYGIFGPRIVWIWDRFRWSTVDTDEDGNSSPETAATYSNTVSNRLYGVHAGFGHDWFLGSTPIGAFAFNLDIEGGLYLDIVKTRAAWDREDGFGGARRGRRHFRLSPGAEVRAGLKWYPWEAISLELGYEVQTFFNTVASPRPVDFNFASVDPEYRTQLFRWWHGVNFNICFVF
jgi:hypothetical protein